MKTRLTVLVVVSVVALLLAAMASACGSSEEDQEWARQDGWNLVEDEASPVCSRLRLKCESLLVSTDLHGFLEAGDLQGNLAFRASPVIPAIRDRPVRQDR